MFRPRDRRWSDCRVVPWTSRESTELHGARHAVLGTRVFGVEVVPKIVGLTTPRFVHIDAGRAHTQSSCVLSKTRKILQTDRLTASMLSRSVVSDRASTRLPQSRTALKRLQPSRTARRGCYWLQCLVPKSLGPKRQAQWRSVGPACMWRKVRSETHAFRHTVRGVGPHRRPRFCDEGGRDGRLRPKNSIRTEVRNVGNAMFWRLARCFGHGEFE